MESLRVAVATDDGRSFVARHFGDAMFYDLYDVSPAGVKFLQRVANGSGKEHGHADPAKAKGIAGILKAEGVQVALTKAFGANLKRIKSKFVCVLSGHGEIGAGLTQVQANFGALVAEWTIGEQRDYLDLRTPENGE